MTEQRLILHPTDGSATAEAAARIAEDIAYAEGGRVLVLGIAKPTFVGGIEDNALTTAVVESVREVAELEAARIRQRGVDAEAIVTLADQPHDAILDVAAERGANMIVMGTHGRSGLTRAALGSVAERVVKQSTVPIVLVPLVEDVR